ncbi:hypothetical protein HDC93_007352, partial [Streptomyces sp. AK010]|nr:hypothetical protein [Streptomyces sp. AK010]MBB6421719.1 hypothetical protein [Streptomyces sp. AK010]
MQVKARTCLMRVSHFVEDAPMSEEHRP